MIVTTTPAPLAIPGILPTHSQHVVSEPPLPGLPRSQWLYRFQNGYGASVIRGAGSYGGPEGLFEVAVIRYTGSGAEDFDVLPSLPHAPWLSDLAGDVHGWCSEEDVAALITRIAAIPPPFPALEAP